MAERSDEQKLRREMIAYLRKLARWKNNDVVKLLLLKEGGEDQADRLDLTGVVEMKRNANGAFEVKLVDKMRVLEMMRELTQERRDGKLEDFLDGLYRPGNGDEQ